MFWFIFSIFFYCSFVAIGFWFFFLYFPIVRCCVDRVQEHHFLSVWQSAVSLVEDAGSLGRKRVIGMCCFSFTDACSLISPFYFVLSFHCHECRSNRQLTLFFRTRISFIISVTKFLNEPKHLALQAMFKVYRVLLSLLRMTEKIIFLKWKLGMYIVSISWQLYCFCFSCVLVPLNNNVCLLWVKEPTFIGLVIYCWRQWNCKVSLSGLPISSTAGVCHDFRYLVYFFFGNSESSYLFMESQSHLGFILNYSLLLTEFHASRQNSSYPAQWPALLPLHGHSVVAQQVCTLLDYEFLEGRSHSNPSSHREI